MSEKYDGIKVRVIGKDVFSKNGTKIGQLKKGITKGYVLHGELW